MKNSNRKFRMSKLIGTTEVLGHVITYYITEDLTDEELKQHFSRAISDQDFEYAQAVSAEAWKRGFSIVTKETN